MNAALAFVNAWYLSRSRPSTERGASLVEYALLVAFIAIVCVAAVALSGRNVSSKFSSITSGVG